MPYNMLMGKKPLIPLSVMILLIAGYFSFRLANNQGDRDIAEQNEIQESFSENPDENESASAPAADSGSASQNSSAAASSSVPALETMLDVPFVVQAPFAEWSDPTFQNACEEASIIMAMGWLKGEKEISPTETKRRILYIVAFEDQAFGYDTDTDVSDMARIFREHFGYSKIEPEKGVSLDDIRKAVTAGQLVLVPTFGQALDNPHYTAPGPIVHMLAIIGYDPAKKEFVTNDPGTKHGAGYRYAENVLFDAVWGYPSGKDVPEKPAANRRKDMLIISK